MEKNLIIASNYSGSQRCLRSGRKKNAMVAVLCCMIAFGAFLTACGAQPENTQPPVGTTEALPSTDTLPVIPETEQTQPTTEPLVTTEPIETEPVQTEPSILDSAAYQKLLSLPNAELYLCNEFGYSYLEIFAEWIVSQEGLMEAYPEAWHLKGYADGGAGFYCHSPLAEDNSCQYYYIQIVDYNNLIPAPNTGTRYFTDVPRGDVAPLVYNAHDPVGVEDSVKEAFVDYILYSDWFAWSVLDPGFRTEWYYEIVTINPEPEISIEQLRLCVDVWRPGMAEEEPFRCWLVYDEDWKQVSYGTEGEVLTAFSGKTE